MLSFLCCSEMRTWRLDYLGFTNLAALLSWAIFAILYVCTSALPYLFIVICQKHICTAEVQLAHSQEEEHLVPGHWEKIICY